ncbi:MAG: hypothetical protein WBD20_17825 [Pirellulaceae bacterium]
MTPDESFQTPFDSDETATETNENMDSVATDADVTESAEATNDNEPQDPEVKAAKDAWDADEVAIEDSAELAELAQPFVGQWNSLISTTNWEKGRIISQWREALVASEADATQYSDEAWARRVGGVTAPHVGRLRRVYDRFGSTFATYDDIYWSHFLAALDWDDAPLWLEGASKEHWSVSNMREKRWQATGAVESNRPTDSQIIEVDLDEDITLPAQGGGREKEYDGDSSGVASGPLYEEPDFGDEEELSALGAAGSSGGEGDRESETPKPSVQPFVGLPKLPEDLSEAIESLKLSVLRHKTSGWNDVTAEDVQKYLDAVGVMLRA